MENSELVKNLLILGSCAGAVAALAALTMKCAKLVKRVVDFFHGMKTSIDTLIEHDNEQYLSILRLTVMSENIPLSERISAGKEYIKAGGNGDVRHYYETYLKPHDKIKKGNKDNVDSDTK